MELDNLKIAVHTCVSQQWAQSHLVFYYPSCNIGKLWRNITCILLMKRHCYTELPDWVHFCFQPCKLVVKKPSSTPVEYLELACSMSYGILSGHCRETFHSRTLVGSAETGELTQIPDYLLLHRARGLAVSWLLQTMFLCPLGVLFPQECSVLHHNSLGEVFGIYPLAV